VSGGRPVKLVRTAVAAASGAALAFGGATAWDSPALELRTVEVGGNRNVAASDVVLASGLSSRDHLLRMSAERVASRVEEAPWVAAATVERILPSKVRITVTERRAAAVVVAGPDGWLADGEGVVLERLPTGTTAAAPQGLPVLVELPVGTLATGDRLSQPQYRQALSILRALPASIRDRVVTVRTASTERITLEFGDGTTILYGPAEALGDKAFAVEALLHKAELEKTPLASIDVRVPTRPAVRLR
jgi:cell division protein FtsQ